MFILSLPGSLVFVIRVIPIFSDCRRFSRLVIFPFMPFKLIAAMVSVLFFSDYFPFCSIVLCSRVPSVLGGVWSYYDGAGFTRLLVVGYRIFCCRFVGWLFSLSCYGYIFGFWFLVLGCVLFHFVCSYISWCFIRVVFLFCGWSEGYPSLFSTATVCFVLFVSLCFFQDLYCWVNFFRGYPVPASAPLWAGCWVSSPVIFVRSVVALVSGWWVFLVAVPVTLSREVVASVSVPNFLVVVVAAVVVFVVLVMWIRSWAGLSSCLVIWVVGSFLVVMVDVVVASGVLVVWIGSWGGLGSFLVVLVVWVMGSFRWPILWCWVSLGVGS